MSSLRGLAGWKSEEIYPRLTAAAKAAAIDRQVVWGEKVIAPIYGAFAKEGAEKFLAVLAYPESMEKRLLMLDALQAAQLKQQFPRHSDGRKLIRASGGGALLDMPNKRIDQVLNNVMRRLKKRNRAAWVMVQKLASSPEPDKQDSMLGIILKTALQTTGGQQQYGCWKGDDDENYTRRSFDKGVMVPSRNVIHLAMAFYAYFETNTKAKSINIKELTLTSREWLQPVIIAAELIRLSFGDWFPMYTTTQRKKRRNNFNFEMSESVSILPYLGEIKDSPDYAAYMEFCSENSSF